MKNIKSTYLRTNKAKKEATLVIDRLNLGNNWTYQHFIEAIAERIQQSEKLENIIQDVSTSIDSRWIINIVSKGNYTLVRDCFVIFEFFECLNSELLNEIY